MMHRVLRLVAALCLAAGLGALAPAALAGQAQRPVVRVDPLTALIQGRVTTADSGAPIRRAEVRAIAASGFTRLALTDGDGRFTLRDMPAGDYRLHASRAGFVPLEYGQRRPFEAAIRITLKEGERVSANLMLPRAGAITGRITDATGEPLAGTRVQALRARTVDGRRRLVPAGVADVTDDTGAFRVYALPPGDYYVAATPPEAHMPTVPRGALPGTFPPNVNVRMRESTTTFYPGTVNVAEAERLTLGVGGEARADMQIVPANAATVGGIVLDSRGMPVPDAMVNLRSGLVSIGFFAGDAGMLPMAINGHAAADGTFELHNVPAGTYVLQASTGPMNVRVVESPAGPMEVATGESAEVPVTVAGGDVTGLTVTTGPSSVIEATVVADTGVTRALPSNLELDLRTSEGGPRMMMQTGDRSTVRFLVSSPGFMDVKNLPDDWAVKAIIVNGVETADSLIQPRGGTTAVRVVLTDKTTEVSGSIAVPAAPADTPPGDRQHSVVIFSSDPARWSSPSRYLRAVKADASGAFRVRGLPGNERYLAIAVDYLEDGEGGDPEFLERMQQRATPFVLGEAERKTISLPLVER